MNRYCRKCHQVKPIELFTKRHGANRLQKYEHRCKACVVINSRKWELANRKRKRELDRKNYNPATKRANHERLLASPGFRADRNKRSKEYRLQNREKHLAHVAVQKAVREGRMFKPDYCNRCELPKILEAHHPDYSKPLSVLWLCQQCHRRAHMKDIYAK